MATVKKNLVTEGLSGKLGDMLIFRTGKSGKTIVTTASKTNDSNTEAQKIHRAKFQMAAVYGKAAMTDPITKASYQLLADKQLATI